MVAFLRESPIGLCLCSLLFIFDQSLCVFWFFAAFFLVFQGAGGEGGHRGAEERPGDQRHSSFR